MKIFHRSRPWVYIFDGTMIFKGFVQMQGKYKQGTADLDRGEAEMVYLCILCTNQRQIVSEEA